MDILIVGAGAAGLMAAKKLSAAGLKVTVLEGRSRLGGRIFSIDELADLAPVEGGAEFVHGNLDETLNLLKEAGMEPLELEGEFWNVRDGKWNQENEFFSHYELVIEKLKELQEDTSIAGFLDTFFQDEKYAGLQRSLRSYVEGYYSGEPERTSAKAFLEECLSEDEQQYRPKGGYGKMIQYLADQAVAAGATIHLETAVKVIRWTKGRVEMTDANNRIYKAAKALVTVPLGIWTAAAEAKGAIEYQPSLYEKTEAARQMGFGAVIKILIHFKTRFWQEDRFARLTEKGLKKLHMALTDQPIPTWWTQLPAKSSLLTGWLSGPAAARMKNEDEATILNKAIQSISNIFRISEAEVKGNITSSQVLNWTTDAFTLGSYSYSTLQTEAARKILMEPLENTLFFAGEALYEGAEMGTVEAALVSAIKAAEQIMT